MKLKKYLVRYTARPRPGWAQIEVEAQTSWQAIEYAAQLKESDLKMDKPHDPGWWLHAQPTAVEI